MPYIAQESREKYDEAISSILEALPFEPSKAAGDFTYIIYRILKDKFTGRYADRALGLGCLMCAILEIYRKEHSLYEDKKIAENGAV